MFSGDVVDEGFPPSPEASPPTPRRDGACRGKYDDHQISQHVSFCERLQYGFRVFRGLMVPMDNLLLMHYPSADTATYAGASCGSASKICLHGCDFQLFCE